MGRLLVITMIVVLAATAARAETFVYVPVAAEKRIAVYQMDRATGKLTHRGDAKLDGEPGALTVDPGRPFLFAALRAEGQLASFRIDPATGMLKHLNTVPAGPDPAHLSTGAAKAHPIVLDPSGRFAFVPHTGPDTIFQFAFGAKAGRLTANSPAKLPTPKGTGPRHLVFHPSHPIAYVANEQGGSVTAYALDPKAGTLSPLQTVSTLPKDYKGTNACAEIRIDPSGKFLYVSNRGHDSIACFALDDDGKVSAAGQEPTEKTPRSFDLDPAGKYLFAAGESSGNLAA